MLLETQCAVQCDSEIGRVWVVVNSKPFHVTSSLRLALCSLDESNRFVSLPGGYSSSRWTFHQEPTLVSVQHMLKITMLGGDTEVISIYEPAAVRRQRLVVCIDVEQSGG